MIPDSRNSGRRRTDTIPNAVSANGYRSDVGTSSTAIWEQSTNTAINSTIYNKDVVSFCSKYFLKLYLKVT